MRRTISRPSGQAVGFDRYSLTVRRPATGVSGLEFTFGLEVALDGFGPPGTRRRPEEQAEADEHGDDVHDSLIGGGVKAVGWIDVDLLGIFAAAAAAATAWMQAKQHRNLATAYGVTSQELAAIASELEALSDESAWADFVTEAEDAISREHTLWRASLGVSAQRRRN